MIASPPAGPATGAPWTRRALLLPTLALTVLALAEALLERYGMQPGRLAFTQLFGRNEPAGAALMLLLLLVAPLLATRLPAAELLAAAAWRRRGVLAAVATVLLVALALPVYRGQPLSMDEYAHVFQARVFAAGRLTGHFPPALVPWLVPPEFANYFLAVSPRTGAVIGAYWPGFALLLAPFTWAGVPWLLDPLLTGATLLLVTRLAHRLTGSVAAAGWALLLTLASPVVAAGGVSFYPLQAHLLLDLVFADLLLVGPPGDVRLADGARRLLAAGAVGSLALVLSNPVPHLVFALPWLAALAHSGPRRLLACLAGYLPIGASVGVGWFRLRSALTAAMGTVGASARSGARPVTSATGLAADLLHRMFGLPGGDLLHARLLGLLELHDWGAPFLLALAVAGFVAAPRSAALRLLGTSAAATLLFYLFVRVDQGHGWGYRYIHPAWAAFPILAGAALAHSRAASWRPLVLAATLLAMPAANALRLTQVASFVGEQLAQLPAIPADARRICFYAPDPSTYGSDRIQNDPFLRNRVWLLLSRGREADARLLAERFPAATLERRGRDYTLYRLPER